MAITNIEHYISRVTFDQFQADQKTGDAVMCNLEVIGEATRHIAADQHLFKS